MRFNFGSYAVAFDEADDARVVFEDAEAPARVDFSCGFCYVRFEEAADFRFVYAYFAFEGFVEAVLRPRLRYGLKFHVSWVSSFLFEVSLDGFHLLQVQA